MKRIALVLVVVVSACKKEAKAPDEAPDEAREQAPEPETKAHETAPRTFRLTRLRNDLKTKVDAGRDSTPAPTPPPELFEVVHYDAPLGKQVAHASPVKQGEKRPAIIWIVGGLVWGLGDTAWAEAPRENDQSARAFREAGIVMMYPALRGASGNPGHNECFLGEVDDIIAAAAYLTSRPDVDPARIYLGGHSTGGTLALFTAASTERFRAVFALGAVVAAEQYGPDGCLPGAASEAERVARSVYPFFEDVVTPTFVIEGSGGNAAVLPLVAESKGSAPISVVEVPGFDHFSVIAPTTEVIARAIVADKGFHGVTAAAIAAAK